MIFGLFGFFAFFRDEKPSFSAYIWDFCEKKSSRGVERVFHTPAYRRSGHVAGVCQMVGLPETVGIPAVAALGITPGVTFITTIVSAITGIITSQTAGRVGVVK
jgi:hypothetical protein